MYVWMLNYLYNITDYVGAYFPEFFLSSTFAIHKFARLDNVFMYALHLQACVYFNMCTWQKHGMIFMIPQTRLRLKR